MANDDKLQSSLLGLDDIIEDLFGLNAKAFRSIWMSFKNPAQYARAATKRDWAGAFTPSARVWIGLLAFYSALRFFYGSDDGAMTQMYVDMFEQAIAQNPSSPIAEIDLRLFAQLLLKWTFLFFPLIMLPLYALIAFVFRPWPDKPSYVLRFRYIMLTVIPGATLTALVTIASIFLTGPYLGVVLASSTLGIIVLDGMTAHRGTLHSLTPKARIGWTIFLTVLLLIAFIAGSFLAAIPAGSAALMEIASAS